MDITQSRLKYVDTRFMESKSMISFNDILFQYLNLSDRIDALKSHFATAIDNWLATSLAKESIPRL